MEQVSTHYKLLGSECYHITHEITCTINQTTMHTISIKYQNVLCLRMVVVVSVHDAKYINSTPLNGFMDYCFVSPNKHKLLTTYVNELVTTYHIQQDN